MLSFHVPIYMYTWTVILLALIYGDTNIIPWFSSFWTSNTGYLSYLIYDETIQ